MEKEDVHRVMRAYGKAWEKQDTKTILRCFSSNGVYQESRLAKPYRGHAQIRRFWERVVVCNTRRVKFSLKTCYVSKDRKTGFAEWECTNEFREKKNAPWVFHLMVGIMVLRMRAGKITYLNEYWNMKKE
ncbi:MAG: nuclear transport factor 2 family protein [Candidatus Diapherotrites archaeon]